MDPPKAAVISLYYLPMNVKPAYGRTSDEYADGKMFKMAVLI
jgi:hypothetical protein